MLTSEIIAWAAVAVAGVLMLLSWHSDSKLAKAGLHVGAFVCIIVFVIGSIIGAVTYKEQVAFDEGVRAHAEGRAVIDTLRAYETTVVRRVP